MDLAWFDFGPGVDVVMVFVMTRRYLIVPESNGLGAMEKFGNRPHVFDLTEIFLLQGSLLYLRFSHLIRYPIQPPKAGISVVSMGLA